MAGKIIGVEVKSLVYDIEDSKTRSIAKDALSNANSAVIKASETADALMPVAQSVAEIEANIGDNDISEIASKADTAMEAVEEIGAIEERIGTADISALAPTITEAENVLSSRIGDLSKLVTADKTNLVGAINEQKAVSGMLNNALFRTDANGRLSVKFLNPATKTGVAFLIPSSDANLCVTWATVLKGATSAVFTVYLTGSLAVNYEFWASVILV